MTAYGQIQSSLAKKSATRDRDVSHSPTCSGSSFWHPKMWHILPISMAGFCLPPFLPDILYINTAAPKALAAINHFFITSSILSALQAHLYPSVFPPSFNPDFDFSLPQSLPFDQYSFTLSCFSNFLIPTNPLGPSFP